MHICQIWFKYGSNMVKYDFEGKPHPFWGKTPPDPPPGQMVSSSFPWAAAAGMPPRRQISSDPPSPPGFPPHLCPQPPIRLRPPGLLVGGAPPEGAYVRKLLLIGRVDFGSFPLLGPARPPDSLVTSTPREGEEDRLPLVGRLPKYLRHGPTVSVPATDTQVE